MSKKINKSSINKNQKNNSKKIQFDSVPTLKLQIKDGTTFPGGNVNMVTAIGMLHEALDNLEGISKARYMEQARKITVKHFQKKNRKYSQH